MRTKTRHLLWGIFVLTLAPVATTACQDMAKARQTCEKAGDKYSGCIKEMLGAEAGKITDGKRDIESCAKDDKTVAMYEACLPKTACNEFMDCIQDYAAKN